MDQATLEKLILDYLDRQISDADLAALEAELSASQDARATYWDLVDMDEALDGHFREQDAYATATQNRFDTGLRELFEQEQRLLSSISPPTAPTEPEGPPQSLLRKSMEPESAAEPWQAGPVDRRPQEVVRLGPIRVVRRTSDASPGARNWGRTLEWLTAAAAAIVVIVLLLPAPKSDRTPSHDRTAVVTQALEAQWQNEEREPVTFEVGDHLPYGKFHLSEGFAEIEMASGATLVVQSPASLHFDQRDDAITLTRGRASINTADGPRTFTVHTPAADIKDLGTEFGVTVDADDQVSTAVFQGTVELASRRTHASADASPLRLEEGYAAQWRDTDEPEVRSIDENPAAFASYVRQMPRNMQALSLLQQLGNQRMQDVELTDDGAVGYNAPHAVYHAGKLFWSYLDGEGTAWAASYDVDSGAIERTPVWEGARDLHQASPVLIRPDGRVQIFINRAGAFEDDRLFWRVSERPGQISAFGPLRQSASSGVLQGRNFKPLVHEPTGDVYVVVPMRDGTQWPSAMGMWHSTDGGDTFDTFHPLFDLGREFDSGRSLTRAFLEGDQIHLLVMRIGWRQRVAGYPIGRTEGVYYTRYDINEQAFFHADGTRAFDLDQAPTANLDHFDTIWHWQHDGHEQQRAMWADLVARDGHPYVALVSQQAKAPGQSSRHTGYWASPDSSGRWRRSRVTELPLGWDSQPERVNLSIALDPDQPYNVLVARSTDPDHELAQVHRMRSNDGGQSWESIETLSNHRRISTLIVPRTTDDTHQPFSVLWLEGQHSGWRSYDTRIMTHEPHEP